MTIIDKITSVVESIQDENLSPFFYFGKWFDLTETLTEENVDYLTMGKNYPFVFLLLPIPENVNYENNFNTANITLFIVGQSELTETNIYRHENNFEILRTIEENLIESLQRNKVKFTQGERIELFFDKTEKSKINTNIDAIRLNISELSYFNKC